MKLDFVNKNSVKKIVLQNNKMCELLDLPVLVVERVLNQLSYNDLLSLRRTCKAWQNAIDSRLFKNLFVFVEDRPFPVNLFYSNELVHYCSSLHLNRLKFLRSVSFKTTFRHIQKLSFYRDAISGIHLKHMVLDLKDLNCFEQLVHLEIRQVGIIRGVLSSKKLQVCLLKTRIASEFVLDCENLRAFGVLLLARPKLVSSAEKIDYLYVAAIVDRPYLVGLFRKCRNASVVCFGSDYSPELFLEAINQGRLSLPLKEIRLYRLSNFGDSLFNGLSSLIRSSKEHTWQLFLSNQPVTLDDLVEISKLFATYSPASTKCDKIDSDSLRQIAENSSDRLLVLLLSLLCEIHLGGDFELDDRLARRLGNLVVCSIQSDFPITEQTMRTLANCTQLRCLVLNWTTQPEQRLFDRIPRFLPFLKQLVVNHKLDSVRSIADFANLEYVFLAHKLEQEELVFLVEHCRLLQELRFRSGKHAGKNNYLSVLKGKRVGRFECHFNRYNRPHFSEEYLNAFRLEDAIDGKNKGFINLRSLVQYVYSRKLLDKFDDS